MVKTFIAYLTEANLDLTIASPEEFAHAYGMRCQVGDERGGGEYSDQTIYVDDDRQLMNGFAADWTAKNSIDMKTARRYPANICSAAHEIAHGLFSKRPDLGHKALAALIDLGVPKNVAFESLVDVAGLWLLEETAVSNQKLRSVVENWMESLHVKGNGR